MHIKPFLNKSFSIMVHCALFLVCRMKVATFLQKLLISASNFSFLLPANSSISTFKSSDNVNFVASMNGRLAELVSTFGYFFRISSYKISLVTSEDAILHMTCSTEHHSVEIKMKLVCRRVFRFRRPPGRAKFFVKTQWYRAKYARAGEICARSMHDVLVLYTKNASKLPKRQSW